MQFPWKKVKSTRLSRLVNDHLHKSQKRRDGSSLVVETGFPTSLVDLFIKNREKLKKSGKKRGRSVTALFTEGNDSGIGESPAYFESPPPPPPPPSSPMSSLSGSVHCPSPESSLLSPGNGVIAVESRQGGDCPDSGFDVRNEFLVVLKTVLVACFAVGSKRLTVGITFSAFLLVFLENVGRHVCRLLKPSLDFEGVLSSLVRRICVLLRFKDVKLDHSSSFSSSQSPNQEIQIEEMEEEIQEIEFEEEVPIGEEEETTFDVAELKRPKSRREKIRSKMQKLFQKKSSRSRKEHEIDILKQECVSHNDQQEEEAEHQPESESDPRLHSITTTNKEEATKIASRPSWNYNLALSLIILTGLIGGRASALVLTLSSCLLFKLIQTLPRYIKEPAIRRFTT